MTPKRLTGKELEKLCLIDAQWSESRGLYTMGRYGVQVSIMKDAEGKLVTRPIQSLPDFEGVTIDGVQFIFDCKVCSGASFPLNNSHFAERQLRHLLTRADFGATCFLMLHFNERELTKRTVAAATYAFPVHREHPFWLEYFRGEVKSVGRLDCVQHGMTVWWREPDRCRVARPDILSAVDMIRSSRSLIEA